MPPGPLLLMADVQRARSQVQDSKLTLGRPPGVAACLAECVQDGIAPSHQPRVYSRDVVVHSEEFALGGDFELGIVGPRPLLPAAFQHEELRAESLVVRAGA